MIENEGYWVPHDAVTEDPKTLISNTLIKDLLDKTQCKHALLLVDSYFGGASFKYSNLTIKNTGEEGYYDVIDGLISRQAIATGGIKPTSDGNGEHSVFVKYLVKFFNIRLDIRAWLINFFKQCHFLFNNLNAFLAT